MVAGGGNKLPYGNLPRLLLAWVSTEAVRTQSRVLVLGKSLSEFTPRRKKMKPKISIGTCQRAIAIVERASEIAGVGIPVMIRGEQVVITRALRVQGQHWISGDIRLPRASQEELTMKARAFIAEDERQFLERFPPRPPTISIRECQQAIEIAGAISITLRGEEMRITEIATRDISRWVSGDIRFTPKEKELLTNQARAIIAGKDTASQ